MPRTVQIRNQKKENVVEVTNTQEYHVFVLKNDRKEQRFSLYIRLTFFKKILKSIVYSDFDNTYVL